MELLTGKCWSDFKKWVWDVSAIGRTIIFYYDRDQMELDINDIFDKVPTSMQYGVLVDFFDSKGISIGITKVSRCVEYRYFIENKYSYAIDGDCDTRQEARTEAIKKANELYNKNNE